MNECATLRREGATAYRSVVDTELSDDYASGRSLTVTFSVPSDSM